MHLFFIPFHLIPSLSTFCLPFIPLWNLWLSIIFFVYSIWVFWKAWHCCRYFCSCCCCCCCCCCRAKKKFCSVFSKSARHINFKFWPFITASCTNEALVIILWYSEWINGYGKNLSMWSCFHYLLG